MDHEIALICGNWGGTNLRIYRLDKSGDLVGSVMQGKGINELSVKDQKAHWFDLIGDARHKPALICGSAGSNLGWLHTGYVSLPAHRDSIVKCVSWREIDGQKIGIIPGLNGRNAIDEPDTMRSEETELIGYMAKASSDATGLVCLPGTHNKWVRVNRGEIQSFCTSLTGEVYNALNTGTVITRGSEPAALSEAFDQGVYLGLSKRGGFLQKLYAVRSRQIDGLLSIQDSSSFLSGLIIGSDINAALDTFDELKRDGATIIGGLKLTESFIHAFQLAGIKSKVMEGDEACVAGFGEIGRALNLLE